MKSGIIRDFLLFGSLSRLRAVFVWALSRRRQTEDYRRNHADSGNEKKEKQPRRKTGVVDSSEKEAYRRNKTRDNVQ